LKSIKNKMSPGKNSSEEREEVLTWAAKK